MNPTKKKPAPRVEAAPAVPVQIAYNVKNISGDKVGISVDGNWIEILPNQVIKTDTLWTEVTRLVKLGKLSLV